MTKPVLPELAPANLFKLLLLVLLAAVLSACATPARIVGVQPAFERQGRFAVKLQPFDQPAQAVQGGFAWRDEGDLLQLDLSNPFGSVLARAQISPAQALLIQADGSSQSAVDADQLLAQVWGYPMPVNGLRYWVRGQLEPTGTAKAVSYDGQGRLQAFEQQGWQLQLSGYDAHGPTKIRLRREDQHGSWRLQLVVDTGA